MADFPIILLEFLGVFFFILPIICLCYSCLKNYKNENEPQEEMQSDLFRFQHMELSVKVPNQTVEINMEQMNRNLPPSYSWDGLWDFESISHQNGIKDEARYQNNFIKSEKKGYWVNLSSDYVKQEYLLDRAVALPSAALWDFESISHQNDIEDEARYQNNFIKPEQKGYWVNLSSDYVKQGNLLDRAVALPSAALRDFESISHQNDIEDEAKYQNNFIKPEKEGLPCPECPVCIEKLMPPTRILQCSNGHLICEDCVSKANIIDCPTCRMKIVGRATAMEQHLASLFQGFI